MDRGASSHGGDRWETLVDCDRIRQGISNSGKVQGMSTDDRCLIELSVDDATHLSPEARANFKGSLSPLELESRYYGGEHASGGAVFMTPASAIVSDIDPATLEWNCKWLNAIDFSHGGRSPSAHPFAACCCAYDPFGKI